MRFLLKPYQVIAFVLFYLWKVLQGSLQVGYAAVSPRVNLTPAFIGIPLTATKESEILLLANLISMTPGTLSVDVSPDRKTLYVHCLTAADREAVVEEIKESFEKRVMEVLG